MAESRRREQAVVTGITAEHHNHDNGHIADQTDAPPPQAAGERAGRHHRAHAQRQRAERETDAAHHRSALQQLGDASAQQQSQGRSGERADEGRRQGAAAAQQRLGDGEHHQQRDRVDEQLQDSACQQQRGQQMQQVELLQAGAQAAQRQWTAGQREADPHGDVEPRERAGQRHCEAMPVNPDAHVMYQGMHPAVGTAFAAAFFAALRFDLRVAHCRTSILG